MPAAVAVFDSDGFARKEFARRPLAPGEIPNLHKDKRLRSLSVDGEEVFGSLSVVSTIDIFRRGLEVFTSGLLEDGVGLAPGRAIVVGESVAACLLPWPDHIYAIYRCEQIVQTLLETRLGVPVEIGMMIESYAGAVEERRIRVARGLHEHFAAASSPFARTPVDVYFVADDPREAAESMTEMHSRIVAHRRSVNIEPLISVRCQPKHWVFNEIDPDHQSDPTDDWAWGQIHDERGIEPPPKRALDDRGWNPFVSQAVSARYDCLWTVRTPSTITITGLHPVRHINLHLSVVWSGEEIAQRSSMDFTSLFYDGCNVHATHRAMRAFNTRTNFVESTMDEVDKLRIAQYALRGFTAVEFTAEPEPDPSPPQKRGPEPLELIHGQSCGSEMLKAHIAALLHPRQYGVDRAPGILLLKSNVTEDLERFTEVLCAPGDIDGRFPGVGFLAGST